jgi:hypothetical protein
MITADHPLFDLLVDIELLDSTALFTELAAWGIAAYGLRVNPETGESLALAN